MSENKSKAGLSELAVRVVAFAYVGAFALAGYLVWQPVWSAVNPAPEPALTPLAQLAAGFFDAMILAGPTGGIVVGIVLYSLYLRWGS